MKTKKALSTADSLKKIIPKNKKRIAEKKFFYLCYRYKKLKAMTKANSISSVLRRVVQFINDSNDIIKIGNTYIVSGREVRVIKKVKSDLQIGSHHKFNNYRHFLAETKDGTRMFIQESDISCPVKLVKR